MFFAFSFLALSTPKIICFQVLNMCQNSDEKCKFAIFLFFGRGRHPGRAFRPLWKEFTIDASESMAETATPFLASVSWRAYARDAHIENQ